ncbi:MAG TPA: polyphosphate kinase 2 family protein [Anaerolineaceae bacterium]|jgi:PPK2 family polyphosphate:nucleotide phosphotransferase|nr:polyphosphate kinase 2 family protein [Anaerolineaceae bacterium]
MDHYRVKPNQKIKLEDWDAAETSQFKGSKEDAQPRFEKLARELGELQEVLFAEGKHKILIVFQAMDTGGKDGTVRAVFGQVNPQGVRVANFKTPTTIELAHDYLWRVHQQVPGKGELVIFNRSHYEDVLVVRVHNLVPDDVWKRRYDQINAFEQLLAEEGTTIIKFYLHIDRDEQRERLLERIDVPEKRWKFNPGDLEERQLWTDYMKAYEAVLERTSTPWAPWYIVPANRNWYRNLVVADVLVDTLSALKMAYPQPQEDITRYRSQLT